MVWDGLDAGDETRRQGDYVGLPHDEATDGVVEGEPVTYDGTDIAAAAVDGAGGGDAIFGVLYTYQYYQDPQTGETVRQDQDATVKTSGTVIADLSNVAATPSAGQALGPNGEMLVLGASDSGSDHYEVLLR